MAGLLCENAMSEGARRHRILQENLSESQIGTGIWMLPNQTLV